MSVKDFGHSYLQESLGVLQVFQWMKIESTAEEEDACAVVWEGTEASGVGFDALDFAAEAFGDGVGDGIAQGGEDAHEVALDHPGNLDGLILTKVH